MKVLLYFEGIKYISKSGIGRAFKHQQKALELAGVLYTTNPDDDYDILHINTVYANSGMIISKARKKGAKVIYHAHSTMEDFKNSFLLSNKTASVFKKLLIYLYSKSDCIIAPTPYTKILLESYGIRVPIYPISNGIDLDKFKCDIDKSNAFREYFNIKKDEKVVVSSGLWIKRKGIVDFVEVAKKLPEIKFIWFGETPLYSIPSEIRNIILKEHPENVIFAGYMSGDVYEGAFSGADAFFFPSYEENEGIVILEALASQQLTIVRDIPVYDSWLVDKVNCLKCNSNEEFALTIKNAVHSNTENLVLNGYDVAKERSLYNIGIQLKSIYEEVLTKNFKERDFINKMEGRKPLNIGLFSDTYLPDINGVSISVDTLRKALQQKGHNVYVIAPTESTKISGIISDGGVLRIPGIKLKKIYGYRLSRPYSLKAKNILKKLNLDVVHINTEFIMRIFATSVAKSFKIPIIYTYHTMYEDYTHYITKGYFDKTARKIVAWVSRLISQTTTEIIAPTNKTKKALERYQITKPINIIPTGIELSSFAKASINTAEVEKLIDRYGIEENFRIVFLGRLAKEKNVEFLIRGMKKVLEKDKKVTLIIAGYGPWEENLKNYAEEQGVATNIIFAGKQAHSDVPIIYHSANAFASASTSETQGITFIEAMASGLPVMSIKDESVEGILEENVTGMFFEDEDELARKILLLKNMDKQIYLDMCNAALKRASEFSIEMFGEKVAAVYLKAISETKKNT
jgi:1,2-diacylglycerol-3-alpha-glucose alpha-1,2-glucosyltransferase